MTWHRVETPDTPEPGPVASYRPAYVLELPPLPNGSRRAAVWHPDSDRHPHALACIRRLLSRGYTVCPWPADRAPKDARDALRQVLGARLAAKYQHAA